jgi:hypothetical protein
MFLLASCRGRFLIVLQNSGHEPSEEAALPREEKLRVLCEVAREAEPQEGLRVQLYIGLGLALHAVLARVRRRLLPLLQDGVLHAGEVLLRLLLQQALLHVDAEDGLGALRVGNGAHELCLLADLVGALLLRCHQLFRPLYFHLKERRPKNIVAAFFLTSWGFERLLWKTNNHYFLRLTRQFL